MAATLLRSRPAASSMAASAGASLLSVARGQSVGRRHIMMCARAGQTPRPGSRQLQPTPALASPRYISSTSRVWGKNGEEKPSAADLHALYEEQMKEIQSEREAVFGTTDDASDSPDLSQTAKKYLETSPDSNAQSSPPIPSDWNAEEAYEEREALFGFSEEERFAWSDMTATAHVKASRIRKIREIMEETTPGQEDANTTTATDTQQEAESTSEPSPFSHLTPKGDGVSMVDVGHKTASRRLAVARTTVVFPPEVLSAFQVSSSNNEMIGPKGPIFETAKIAGIMGAKKTSDLIPLCHPLPLDRVHIDIRLIDNRAIIECECRVTHKTGVEMEALTGASVAALTIYDMVKAVSHSVEIGQTVLVRKSGGKSDYVENRD
ncbi:hypothetical protein ACHAXT_012549 [Thalassiosira profunda]